MRRRHVVHPLTEKYHTYNTMWSRMVVAASQGPPTPASHVYLPSACHSMDASSLDAFLALPSFTGPNTGPRRIQRYHNRGHGHGPADAAMGPLSSSPRAGPLDRIPFSVAPTVARLPSLVSTAAPSLTTALPSSLDAFSASHDTAQRMPSVRSMAVTSIGDSIGALTAPAPVLTMHALRSVFQAQHRGVLSALRDFAVAQQQVRHNVMMSHSCGSVALPCGKL